MKPIFLLITFLILTGVSVLPANPFASKFAKMKEKPTKLLAELTYKGYASIHRKYFAIIELDDKQYTLVVGDRLEGRTILRIRPQYLRYQIKDKIYQVPITTTYQ
ncbi:MAG: hypothetical protein COB67_05170 [SAR324 cluster bacterium]|uniref:Uncharacterized protein n=1 Tax=SAR324 cluster bacterium TaxID=2024889 RepID=A0A2A4T5R8_9DELT|nr:MAG: hypothetical protein COB67_05170 [SAR324 cluster bacterium]